MTLYILAAIVVCIILGYVTKINIGLFAIAFSYLIGCFGMGMQANEVIELWPLKIFFVIFAVTLFYNFPLANGALEKLTSHLIYKCRHFPSLLPLVIYLVSTIISGLGAGYYTVIATMAPMVLSLCKRTHLSIVIATLSINYGALAGANFVTSQSGVIFRELMRGSGVANDNTFTYALGVFVVTFLMPVVLLGIYSFVNTNEINTQDQVVTKPEPLDTQQRQSITLIFIMVAVILVFPILNLLMPETPALQFLNHRIDIGFIATIFVLISLVLKLGDERAVIALIPWNTLIMICGMGMLISLGVEIGVVYQLTEWLSTNVPIWIIPILIFVISAIMSIFASTLGVVAPTLFPIVPPLAIASGWSPLLLFICIVLGAQSSSLSPFSSGGSLILGASQVAVDKKKLFNTLLLQAVPIGVGAGIIAVIAIQLIL